MTYGSARAMVAVRWADAGWQAPAAAAGQRLGGAGWAGAGWRGRGLGRGRLGDLRRGGPAAQAGQRDHRARQAQHPGEQERPVEPGGRGRVHDLAQRVPLAGSWPASSRWAWPPEMAWATAGRPPRCVTT